MENERGIFCDHEDDTMVIGAWNGKKEQRKVLIWKSDYKLNYHHAGTAAACFTAAQKHS